MKDTPWTRIQMRTVGLVFCLFVLMMLSGILSGVLKSDFLKRLEFESRAGPSYDSPPCHDMTVILRSLVK